MRLWKHWTAAIASCLRTASTNASPHHQHYSNFSCQLLRLLQRQQKPCNPKFSLAYIHGSCNCQIDNSSYFLSRRRRNLQELDQGRAAIFISSRVTKNSVRMMTLSSSSSGNGDEYIVKKNNQTLNIAPTESTETELATKGGKDLSSVYGTSYHSPVMWQECIDGLLDCARSKDRSSSSSNDDGDAVVDREPLIFVDGTLGGGGHSAALLERLQPGDIVFGCDVDPNALSTASKRFEKYMAGNENTPIFVPVRSNFCDLSSIIPTIVHPNKVEGGEQSTILRQGVGVDGILLDLGVSSHQIDTAERGFAFMKDGPLDMRMGGVNLGSGGLTAADICNQFDEKELKRIFKVYGDEARAKQIAKSIVESRPLTTTKDLVDAVAAVTPEFAKRGRRHGRTATLARIFQSLRIVVNREDLVLEQALTEMCPSLIRTGGRLVVLSYHSMEDRCTKRVIRDGTVHRKRGNSYNDEHDVYGNYIGTPKPFRNIGKAQKATPEEVEVNSRARSAVLRIAERLDS